MPLLGIGKLKEVKSKPVGNLSQIQLDSSLFTNWKKNS